MAAPRQYREIKLETLKWIIIDDRTSDLEKLANELLGLEVKTENIRGFKLESQCKFDPPVENAKNNICELLDLTKGPKPTLDYSGNIYGLDNKEWKKFESNVSFYWGVLYPIISSKQEEINFIFLIDLDFRNKSFCGFDVLTLLRKTLNPYYYQVRFITNVTRKSVKKFIDAEFGGKLAILGDNNHLSFISKDSTFHELPIITKDYYKQFTSTFVKNVNSTDKKSIFCGYQEIRKGKPVICLSNREIKLKICEQEYQNDEIEKIDNLEKIEGAFEKNRPTIVVVDLDLYDDPRECIWRIERISIIRKDEIPEFSVYLVTEKVETWDRFSKSRWKTFLHKMETNSCLEVNEANVSSPIYWRFKISIDPSRQFLHDLRYALSSPNNSDKIYDLDSIKQEMEASLALTCNQDLKKMKEKLDRMKEDENFSIDNLEKPLEKIRWVVVGIDESSVKDLVEKLKKEAEVLKKCKYLNDKDGFIALVVGDTEGDFCKQIKDLGNDENTIFLFEDVMPCYEKTRKDSNKGDEGEFTESIEIIKEASEKEYLGKAFNRIKQELIIEAFENGGEDFEIIKKELENAFNTIIDLEFKKKLKEIYLPKAFEIIKKGHAEAHEKIENELKKEYIGTAFEIIKNIYHPGLAEGKTTEQFVNSIIISKVGSKTVPTFDIFIEAFKKKIEAFKKKIEAFDYKKLPDVLDVVKKTKPYNGKKKERLTKALEIIKKEYKNENFTYRILERTTWSFVAKERNDEWKEIDIDKGKELFKSANKCLDFFVYSYPKKESFFTIDRLFFMREDLKISKSVVRNHAFNELIGKIGKKEEDSISKEYKILAKILGDKNDIMITTKKGYREVSCSSLQWQPIKWGQNNSCDEIYNEAILINRLYILVFVCANSDDDELLVKVSRFKCGIITKFKDNSRMKVWNFLHQKYAFDTHQKTKEIKDNFFTIFSSSLFKYEKDYLQKKFANNKKINNIVQAWLNSN